MTTVAWARPAPEDVQEIRAHIARDSPRYARAVAERIVAAVDRLCEHPLSGRVVPELGQATVREVIEPPYRIVYRVRAEVLEVVAVVHAAREFPADRLPP